MSDSKKNTVDEQVREEVKLDMTLSNDDMNEDSDLDREITEEMLADNFDVKMIRASSKVSVQLNDVWYAFEFSESRAVKNDSRIAEIRNDLWNTVNNEVDNQVQYTIDSILGKVSDAVPPQSQNQPQKPVIPAEYDY